MCTSIIEEKSSLFILPPKFVYVSHLTCRFLRLPHTKGFVQIWFPSWHFNVVFLPSYGQVLANIPLFPAVY